MSASTGITEIIALLLSLGGFGVQPSPSPPSSGEVMAYAPADADFTIHVDLQAFVPNNYKALAALPTQPMISQRPEARRVAEQVVHEVDKGRDMILKLTGVDLTRDVTSATLWIKVPSAGEPEILAAVRGNVPPDLVDRVVAVAGGDVADIGGTRTLSSPDGAMMLGVRSGVLLFGTKALVAQRVSRGYSIPRPRRDSAIARVGALVDTKPFFLVASHPSPEAATRLLREADADSDNVLADVLRSHSFAAWDARHDGVHWTVTANSRKGYDRALMASEGVLDLMRASHFAGRGMVRVVLAALESYAGKEPEIAALLAHRDALLAIAMDVTGDGNFKATIGRDARALTVDVRAVGNKLSDVLPIGGLMPLGGAAAFFLMSRGVADEPAAAEAHMIEDEAAPSVASPDRAAPRALRPRDTWRRVKERRGLIRATP